MIRFLDGPAAGQTLALRRAPLYLRVVGKGTNALDQLNDAPEAGEVVHVYRRVGKATPVHLKCCGKNAKAMSGWWPMAEYRFCPEQPGDETVRDKSLWRAWAWGQSKAQSGDNASPRQGEEVE